MRRRPDVTGTRPGSVVHAKLPGAEGLRFARHGPERLDARRLGGGEEIAAPVEAEPSAALAFEFLQQVDAAVHERDHRVARSGPPVAVALGGLVAGQRQGVAGLDEDDAVHAFPHREVEGGGDAGDARADDDDLGRRAAHVGSSDPRRFQGRRIVELDLRASLPARCTAFGESPAAKRLRCRHREAHSCSAKAVWIPACAGMMAGGLRACTVRTIIPASAGVTAQTQLVSFPRRRESIGFRTNSPCKLVNRSRMPRGGGGAGRDTSRGRIR